MSQKPNTNPWAKDTLLGDWLRICFKAIGLFFLGVMLLLTCNKVLDKPPTPIKKISWQNWDPSIDPGLILDLNYNTGEVTYRKEGPGYSPYIERETFPDQIKEYVLDNVDIEEIWDRMSDEGYLVE